MADGKQRRIHYYGLCMNNITILIPSHMQHLTNNLDKVLLTGATVGDCLNKLVELYPAVKNVLFDEDGALLYFVEVFVNGRTSYPEELAKRVRNGDQLYILTAIGGG